MAFGSSLLGTRGAEDENQRRIDGKAARGGSRRALGDIGNLVGSMKTRQSVKDEKNPDKNEVSQLLYNLRDKAKRSNSVSNMPTWGATRARTSLLRPRSESIAAVPAGTALVSNHKQLRNFAFSMMKDLPDIDFMDRSNPLMVSEFVNDIYSHYRATEPEYAIPSDYMTKQSDINERMRSILVDWLVEVHLKFKLMPETLFLAQNLIDRFLCKKNILRKNLQLVGVTAMLIAAKYEEIYAPEVRDFIYISDKAYNRDQILAMEKLMLNTLKFNLTVPTAYQFINRYLKAAGADKQMETVAFFLAELSLSDYSLLKHAPSKIAAAAVYAAQKTLRKGSWEDALAKHSGYSEADITECARGLVKLHAKCSDAQTVAVHKKYSHSKFLEVSRLAHANIT